jgi:hypothetical protein
MMISPAWDNGNKPGLEKGNAVERKHGRGGMREEKGNAVTATARAPGRRGGRAPAATQERARAAGRR